MHASKIVIENGCQVASFVLGAPVEEIEFDDGYFNVAGTNRGIAILDLAERARELDGAGGAIPASLDANITEDTPP